MGKVPLVSLPQGIANNPNDLVLAINDRLRRITNAMGDSAPGKPGPPGPPGPDIDAYTKSESRLYFVSQIPIAQLQAAIDAGASLIILNAETDALDVPVTFPSTATDIVIQGKGESTVIQRGANMPAGKGFFDFNGATSITIRDLVIEGMVTTSVGVDYATITSPMQANLTLNTSVWIHGGSKRITFENVTLRHTGGYGALLDATAGDVTDVQFRNCLFNNNRPHLFGTEGDLNYGSWTGGIFYMHDGLVGGAPAVKRLTVDSCKFLRNTGNQVWGWCQGFASHHEQIVKTNNVFEDIGLDCLQFGNVGSGACKHNQGRRIGFITRTDTDTPVPRYLRSYWSVFMDTTGYCSGVDYTDNSCISMNGGFIDLDGFRNGSIANNLGRVPVVGDPEYATDSVAVFGQNWWAGRAYQATERVIYAAGAWRALQASTGVTPGTNPAVWQSTQTAQSSTGINAGNTQQNGGSWNLSITNNVLQNMGVIAIIMSYCKMSQCRGNLISHPSTAAGVPIEIYGPTNDIGDEHSAYGNVVTGNRIDYSGGNVCVLEYGPTATGNSIYGNHISGANTGELAFQSGSGSQAAIRFSSASNPQVGSAVSESIFQREGVGSTAALKYYVNNQGGQQGQTFALGDVGPVMNLSKAGAALTGAYSTGNRSTLAFYDCASTGKVTLDSFIAIKGYDDPGSTFGSGADANLLDASWLLLRGNKTAKTIEASLSVSGGTRVWTTLGGSSGPGGAAGLNTQVQYNAAGVLGASANFTFDPVAQQMGVTGKVGFASILAVAGWIQAHDGFYTTDTDGNSIQTLGGVLARGVTVENTAQTRRYTSTVDASGNYIFSDATAVRQRMTVDINGVFTWGPSATFVSVDQAGNMDFTGVILGTTTTGGINLAGTASNAIYVQSGGVTAKAIISIRDDGASGLVISRSIAAARTYGFAVDSSAHLLLRDDTAGTYRMSVDTTGLFTWGTPGSGSAVNINQAGTVSATGNITAQNFIANNQVGFAIQSTPPAGPSPGALSIYASPSNLYYWNGGNWVLIAAGSGGTAGTQTPWLSNINAANYGLYGASYIGVGQGLGEKIAAYDGGAGNIYGIGIQGGIMQLMVPTGAAGIVVGFGASASLAASTIFTKTGVGIGTGTPTNNLEVGMGVLGTLSGIHITSSSNTVNSGVNVGQSNVNRGRIMWFYNANPALAYLSVEAIGGNPLVLQQTSGNVGIGTLTPRGALSINSSATPTTIAAANQIVIGEASSNPSYFFNMGYAVLSGAWAGVIQVGVGGPTGPLLLNPSGGNVGIGTTAPAAPLSFANALGKKIDIYNAGAGAVYGMGLNNSQLQIYAPPSAKTSIGYGDSTSFSETLSVMGGYVNIGLVTPTSQLHMYAGNSDVGAPLPGYASIYVQDAGTAPGNGGGVVFGAGQGYFAGIKGYLTGGAGPTGQLVFWVRVAAADARLTPSMRILADGAYPGVQFDGYSLHNGIAVFYGGATFVSGAVTFSNGFSVTGILNAAEFNSTAAISSTNVAFQAGNGAVQIFSDGHMTIASALAASGSIQGNSFLVGAYTVVDTSVQVHAINYWIINGSGPIIDGSGNFKGNVDTAGYITCTGRITTSMGIISSGGIQALGFNTPSGSGQNWTIGIAQGFSINGAGVYHNLIFSGGSLISAS